jgi:hypothetical protein
MKRTKTAKVTYLGRRAEVWEERTGGPYSDRRVFTRWIDDATETNGGYPAGTVTVRRVKGDGRNPNFVVIEPTRIIEGA